jgi:putative thioredoxin
MSSFSSPGVPGGFNTHGAVDLAALAAQRAARERAEAARSAARDQPPGAATDGAPASSSWVLEVDEATFQSAVIDRSMLVPVVIDFWADWAEPSQQLSPLLEQLVAEGAGSWLLGRVNVDGNPRIAQAFQVQSVPTVFVVWQGQLVPGFSGALPEPELRSFVAQVARLSTELPAGAPAEGPDGEALAAPLDPLEEAALDALDAGDLDGAAAAFTRLVDAQPDNADARIGLARVELMIRTAGTDPAAVLAAAEQAPADVAAQTLAADVEVAGGQVESAIARLVALVRASAGADRDTARTHLIGLFALLGDDDPRVPAGRTALANALF